MLYPLYEYYSHSPMDLYQVRKHFLDRFYYQDHGRRDAEKVLKVIVSSSKVDRLLKESFNRRIVPNAKDFLTLVNSMWKFLLRSNDTQILAALDIALRWDMEVNQRIHLVPSEDFRMNVLRVFDEHQIYKEMSREEFFAFVPSDVDLESNSNRLPRLRTWSLTAFSREFGDMEVREFANSETGDTFHSCVFTNGYTRTFVNFSSKLGELTEDEIHKEKDDLVIVQLPNGKYKLARKKEQ